MIIELKENSFVKRNFGMEYIIGDEPRPQIKIIEYNDSYIEKQPKICLSHKYVFVMDGSFEFEYADFDGIIKNATANYLKIEKNTQYTTKCLTKSGKLLEIKI